MKYWSKFYECECSGEGMAISGELIEEKELSTLDIAFWKIGNDGTNLSFLERIRWCMHILFKGKIYSDMVIVNKTTVKNLITDLTEWLNK